MEGDKYKGESEQGLQETSKDSWQAMGSSGKWGSQGGHPLQGEALYELAAVAEAAAYFLSCGG